MNAFAILVIFCPYRGWDAAQAFIWFFPWNLQSAQAWISTIFSETNKYAEKIWLPDSLWLIFDFSLSSVFVFFSRLPLSAKYRFVPPEIISLRKLWQCGRCNESSVSYLDLKMTWSGNRKSSSPSQCMVLGRTNPCCQQILIWRE